MATKSIPQLLRKSGIGRTFGSGRVSTFDKIQQTYLYHENYRKRLSKEENKILDRWLTAYGLLMQHKPLLSKRKVALKLADMYNQSERQGYLDIAKSEEIFSVVLEINKKFQRAKYVAQLESAASKALKAGEFMSFRAILSEAIKIQRLDEPDVQEDDTPRDYQLNIIIQNDDGPQRITADLLNMESIPFSDFKVLADKMDNPRVGIAQLEDMLDEEDKTELE